MVPGDSWTTFGNLVVSWYSFIAFSEVVLVAKQSGVCTKDKILFLGMCSMEDFPLPSPNPFSANFPRDMYVGMFRGWLHMFRNPQDIFPSHANWFALMGIF